MAKMADLSFSDQPLEDPKVQDFIDELTEMGDDPQFAWAITTIYGIRQTIENARKVTPKQYIAIRNIRTSVAEREDRPRWSRRYEGR